MKRSSYHRRQIMKDVLVLQLKLALDTLRDFVLSPVSLILAVIDVLADHRPEQSLLNKLKHFGMLSDRWINVFGEYDDEPVQNVDHWVSEVERKLRKKQP